MSEMTRLRVATLVFIVLCASGAPVEAQPPLRASPFRGALIPGGAMAGDADATSLETNPGQLGLLDGPSTALVIDQWQRRTPRAGRGEAFLLATPLFGG